MYNYNKVVLALGSNLGDRKQQLIAAIDHIHNKVAFVTQTSAIYETPAWGFESYPFYNMCIMVHTYLSPEELLLKLKKIELDLGRAEKKSDTYEARTVDIDIIYYNDLILNTDNLTIPHPQMHHRKFVLVPLTDLSIEWKHPFLQKSIDELLLNTTDTATIKKMDTIALPKEEMQAILELKFLAIEGNIGAGKTTLTQMIAQDFNARPIFERFADNPFLPKFYKEPQRYAFPLEMSFLADRYAQLQHDLGQYNLFNDFIIADYYIYKSLIFAQVTLDTDEVLLYRTIFDVMYKEVTKPDLYVFLHQNTSNLLRNIKKRGRGYEEQIQSEYLNNINKSYSEFIKTLPQQKVLIIDVSDKDFVENQEDYLEILSQINNKILSASHR